MIYPIASRSQNTMPSTTAILITISDALATVRCRIWTLQLFSPSRSDGDIVEIQRDLLKNLFEAACSTA